MKTFIIFLLSLIVGASAFANSSYPELARLSVDRAWQQFEAEAKVLDNPQVLPHQTKELRKRIVALREVLDLFAYSYAYQSRKKDPWMAIRDELDHAYELVGQYKDLFDIQGVEESKAQYKNKDLKELRGEVLGWWERWSSRSEGIYQYLIHPSEDEIYERRKEDLSKFYWGVSELVPSLEISGEQNLALLSQDLLQSAHDSWPEVRKIKTPTSSLKQENKFHDFRKRIRSVARILRTYPNLYSGSEDNLVKLEGLTTRYGEINDLILVYHKAVDDKKQNKAKDVADDIKEAWEELVHEQESFVVELLEAIIEDIPTQD